MVSARGFLAYFFTGQSESKEFTIGIFEFIMSCNCNNEEHESKKQLNCQYLMGAFAEKKRCRDKKGLPDLLIKKAI